MLNAGLWTICPIASDDGPQAILGRGVLPRWLTDSGHWPVYTADCGSVGPSDLTGVAVYIRGSTCSSAKSLGAEALIMGPPFDGEGRVICTMRHRPLHPGTNRFSQSLSEDCVRACISPTLPLDRAGPKGRLALLHSLPAWWNGRHRRLKISRP